MENYEINKETYAVLPSKKGRTKIIEKNNVYYFDIKPYEVIDENCKYYGSSYNGRMEAGKKILDCSYKIPIIVEETEKIIFFPTKSLLLKDCGWINGKAIKKIEDLGKKSKILFNNGKEIIVTVSKESLNNQIYRSSRLESIIAERAKAKKTL